MQGTAMLFEVQGIEATRAGTPFLIDVEVARTGPICSGHEPPLTKGATGDLYEWFKFLCRHCEHTHGKVGSTRLCLFLLHISTNNHYFLEIT